MAYPRLAATIRDTIAAIAADFGPPIARYAIPLDFARLFRFVPGSTATADSRTVIGATGGTAGRWLLVRVNDRGADLADANATIGVGGNFWRVLPAATLTDDRTITLATTNAAAGDVLEVTRLDATGNALTFVNGGAGAGTLLVLSAAGSARFAFDGTNWSLRSASATP